MPVTKARYTCNIGDFLSDSYNDSEGALAAQAQLEAHLDANVLHRGRLELVRE